MLRRNRIRGGLSPYSKVALPPLSVPVPSVVVPSLNVTVPVGVAAVKETADVKVTAVRNVEGFRDETTAVELLALGTMLRWPECGAVDVSFLPTGPNPTSPTA